MTFYNSMLIGSAFIFGKIMENLNLEWYNDIIISIVVLTIIMALNNWREK